MVVLEVLIEKQKSSGEKRGSLYLSKTDLPWFTFNTTIQLKRGIR